MESGKILLESEQVHLTIDRLCHQLLEEYADFENACIIGIQPRGVPLADRIYERLKTLIPGHAIIYGKMDITFYRDDFRTRSKPLQASSTDMNFLVEGKRVLLIDDVLYSGRTVQAALTALQHYGRPAKVELLTLVDRRFNRHLPIQSDYTGVTVDALDDAYVKVEWAVPDGEDQILLFAQKAT